VSETVSRGHAAGQQAAAAAGMTPGGAPRRGRRVAVWLAVMVMLAAGGAVAAWRAGLFGPDGSHVPGSGGAPAPATAPVMRRDLSETTPVNATLGYAGSYTVRGQGSGTLTWLPSAGHVIRQGRVLYKVDNGTPVVLLYGRVPDWRALSEGNTGADVTQLNHDLVNLGYADSADVSALGWDYYSWQTSDAVQALEQHLGVPDPSGSLALGSVVFEPGALRVSNVQGSLGGPAAGPVLEATSDRHGVTISLDAAQQSEVKAGDTVTVTLPGGSTTPGTISSVGKVASGSGSSATIPVHVTLTHPSAAGSLDQAPVTVAITTATARKALVVPVGALLAQPAGGYAVEVTRPGNTRHLAPVTIGIFDDSDGLVQVAGPLTSGQHVVVPAT
jgi:hypothetical protein